MALAAGLYWRALRNAGSGGPVGLRYPALFAIGLLPGKAEA